MVIWVKHYETVVGIGVCCKGQLRAFGITHQNRLKLHVHKSVVVWPLFVNKWQFWWSTSITLKKVF